MSSTSTIVLLCAAALALAGCSASGASPAATGGSGAVAGGGTGGVAGSGGLDAGTGGSGGVGGVASGGAGATSGSGRCVDSNPDISGCPCQAGDQPRPCYPLTDAQGNPVDPATRNVGVCRDGTQTCAGSGEFLQWSKCENAVTPTQEKCNDGQDDDCNGKPGCSDPSCATYPGCGGQCTTGQARPCYTGPAGTEGVGTCKAGVQSCTNGQWGTTCTGEVLPTHEVCTDTLDHNCNHFPGCTDVLPCATDPACQPTCKTDPGCVCPTGSGEQATCPDGMVGISKSTGPLDPGTIECCPCTASDCGMPGCCAESVCQGNSACADYQCGPLPADCNGQVGFDCDDFPEDCDIHCCKCTQCAP